MPTTPLRRKVTKGRVVRTPECFEVGQSVHFVAVSPRTWIMRLEPFEEAERLAAALPAPPASPWNEAMTRVRGIAHAAGRRPRTDGNVEDSTTSDAEALAFGTIVAPRASSEGHEWRGTMTRPSIMELPAEVLAQGDIVVATTGVFEEGGSPSWRVPRSGECVERHPAGMGRPSTNLDDGRDSRRRRADASRVAVVTRAGASSSGARETLGVPRSLPLR